MNIKEIIEKVCNFWGITEEELFGKERTNLYVKARREVSRELRKLGLSYPSIGKILKKDHTTIIHYLKSQLNLTKIKKSAMEKIV